MTGVTFVILPWPFVGLVVVNVRVSNYPLLLIRVADLGEDNVATVGIYLHIQAVV